LESVNYGLEGINCKLQDVKYKLFVVE